MGEVAVGLVAVGLVAGMLAAGVARPAVARPAAPLAEPVHAAWNGVRLVDWAERATQLAGIPVILDRGVDPDVTVSRACHGESLGAMLTAVAGSAGATVAVLDGTIRIAAPGRAGAATRGEALRRREASRLPPRRRDALARREPWSWPPGATPRGLVAAAAADAGVVIEGLDMIPHDHLPAASLPALSLGERLDLVLAHYDLRVEWLARGPAGRIVPLPPASGPAAAGGRSAEAGRPGRPAVPSPDASGPGPQPPADARFTLRLEAPLDEAVGMLATRFGLEATIDRAALAARGVAPGEIVRVQVRDASREDVWDAVVKPLGLRWRIDGPRLVIDAAGE